MNACWVLMILVGYRVSHATQSEKPCKVQLKTAAAGDDVLVDCPELSGKRMTFSLYKENEMIFNCSRNHKKNDTRCKPQFTRTGVEVQEKEANKSVCFRLTGVNASSSGVYSCESLVTYPPPFITKYSDMGTLVLVQEPKCPKSEDCTSETGGNTVKILWWILVVVLTIYSLTVTIVAFIYWRKLNNADLQNDYINTKPSAPRNRGKKRGVTNPIPRHF